MVLPLVNTASALRVEALTIAACCLVSILGLGLRWTCWIKDAEAQVKW